MLAGLVWRARRSCGAETLQNARWNCNYMRRFDLGSNELRNLEHHACFPENGKNDHYKNIGGARLASSEKLGS